ncbi:hypothetical protein TOPH_04785 [Tolypocladium ophioglossoides CBS 100239]|uniref:Uncharacterized protein n=1 Tax=Tolypocladium ophioglossoides (strain CBS 100239) TaxID=1163406 RepID=A0A0L0N9B3_TOLOC|nr:hypothetical protein TOPH_04785 [Tolypocladium ophioglossoides CBS 100239]
MATTQNFLLATNETDAGGGPVPGPDSGVEAGASGNSNAMGISTGGFIAIIVVVVVVSVMGVTTAALFFVAKKREWKVRETVRRSARKVVTALTPRRTAFPDSVKKSTGSSRRGRAKAADDVPPTPRLRPEDVEKGLAHAEVKSKGRK